MKLEQFVSEKCKAISTLNTIDAVENKINLLLPSNAPDKEKANVVSRIYYLMINKGWIIESVDDLPGYTGVNMTFKKLCGPNELIETILECKE